ncbi:hypothetical protein BGL48_12020 [Salinivibrio sp. SS3]|uniref:CI protein n=1 Tax=Salinivibrio phage SMHB1 TaxID=1897436 RepID=A0A1D9C9M6_9CAUD|nr:phage repressor protein CI [Salinivibrio sp. BNH]YP_009786947.1 repressor protein CI [Salinivibrio phage SMHB1]AOY11810.1 CI protein [Salinivibrio phage SMHB1]ODP98301.1 hypothetical protein BGL48_12020 [Salinivibrio sp. BNH]
MKSLQPQIKPFPYSKGRALIEKMKQITNVSTDLQFADVIGISKSTIATWVNREMTPFEIVIRLHLATGVSLRSLLLDDGELFDKAFDGVEEVEGRRLINGRLEKSQPVLFDPIVLNDFGVKAVQSKVVELDNEKLLVNFEETSASSGRYVIDIDGTVSINQIQRLPGKRLAINFNESSFTVTDDEISVLGRVVMSMKKE